ncbi:MAG: TonB-dependent receptor [Bacteroidia bacterium]|nr:TonB-dependent receptor [Bacteroidia bacterium]
MRKLWIHNNLKIINLALLILFFSGVLSGQNYYQKLTGVVFDSESHKPLDGANILIETFSKINGASADSSGRFNILLPPGRHTIRISYLGYNTQTMKDILVGTGKETNITVELTESHQQTGEIVVQGKTGRSLNPMAAVSVRTLRSQDASRYAGGFYDPLRMVANFPGVASGNSDDNNEIVIRGNSPRGLLWRLEGIEIPNPNHLSNGQGGSGGAYSVISTNALSGFDFFTGAFPAEYGNAYSGVMDLNLRNGNDSKSEYSLGISVVGAEASAEGPFNKSHGNSWFGNFRYANFGFLTNYGIIDMEDVGIVPRSMDWAFKTSFKTTKTGTFEFFSVGGSSRVGDVASADPVQIKNGADKNEYLDTHFMAVAGVKHLLILPNSKSYLRTTAGFTYQKDISDNDQVDTLLQKSITYSEFFKYPSFRLSVLFNHKFNVYHTIRAGINTNSLFGSLFAKRYVSAAVYDTLINTKAKGWYNSYFVQWKFKPIEAIEINTGLHLLHSGITRELIWEPRMGIVFYLPYNQTISLGSGLHSRLEPLSIYHYKVKIDKTHRDETNSNLKTIKALHFTVGYNKLFGTDWHIGFEAYHQSLFEVPIAVNSQSQYSILNSSYGLPDVILANNGKGKNKGIEFTIEKDFTNSYYFLFTASLFDSKYKAPDGNWYNTYYNNGFIYNLTGGKEFTTGRQGQNTLGFNIKTLIRGGFRYTPVDLAQSMKSKKVVYNIAETYGERLPSYQRVDLGLSYRLNKAKKAWIFMVDIQNVMNRKNIIRNKFSYQSGKITESTSKSVGMVPVATIKVEF